MLEEFFEQTASPNVFLKRVIFEPRFNQFCMLIRKLYFLCATVIILFTTDLFGNQNKIDFGKIILLNLK